jgi:hypothetical protein
MMMLEVVQFVIELTLSKWCRYKRNISKQHYYKHTCDSYSKSSWPS